MGSSHEILDNKSGGLLSGGWDRANCGPGHNRIIRVEDQTPKQASKLVKVMSVMLDRLRDQRLSSEVRT